MSQMTFSDYVYSLRKRKTKREEWVEFVRPYYPNGKRGRPTKGIEKMLRMYPVADLVQSLWKISLV